MLALSPAVLDMVELWQQQSGASAAADSAGAPQEHSSRSRRSKAGKRSRQSGPDTSTLTIATASSSSDLQELTVLTEQLQVGELLSQHYQQVGATNAGQRQQQQVLSHQPVPQNCSS
jgi:hypothetical protein